MTVRKMIAAACVALVAGCASDVKPPALTNTTTVDVLGDKPIQFTAPDDGHVSIYDTNDAVAVFDGRIKKDQVLTINPSDQHVMVGNMTAQGVQVRRGDTLQVMFQPVK